MTANTKTGWRLTPGLVRSPYWNVILLTVADLSSTDSVGCTLVLLSRFAELWVKYKHPIPNVTNVKCFPIVTNTNFEFVVMQVFLADRLLITYLHMIRTEPTLLINISIATGTKYPMGQMKIAMILAGTSMSGMTYGCSDRTCLRVN